MSTIKLEEYLDSIASKYKDRIDKRSDVFVMDVFSIDHDVDLTQNEKKWFKNKYSSNQMVYIPIRPNGQRTHDSGTLKTKYLQIYNGLYISPQLFEFMKFYETTAKRDKFQVI